MFASWKKKCPPLASPAECLGLIPVKVLLRRFCPWLCLVLEVVDLILEVLDLEVFCSTAAVLLVACEDTQLCIQFASASLYVVWQFINFSS